MEVNQGKKIMDQVQIQAMDRMYRYERHIYDITRKYYLFGRDKLMQRMDIQEDEQVLEVGCGTARNLLILAERHPLAHFYGLDASREMLNTATNKVHARQYASRIVLRQCLAEELNYQHTFGLDRPFDKIFFSYSLCMMPSWRKALQVALDNLKPGGKLYVVDFSDQRGLPAWFRYLLNHWLSLFGVRYHLEQLAYLHMLDSQGHGWLTVESVWWRYYAFLAKFQKA